VPGDKELLCLADVFPWHFADSENRTAFFFFLGRGGDWKSISM
jgi:hypothetical protein